MRLLGSITQTGDFPREISSHGVKLFSSCGYQVLLHGFQEHDEFSTAGNHLQQKKKVGPSDDCCRSSPHPPASTKSNWQRDQSRPPRSLGKEADCNAISANSIDPSLVLTREVNLLGSLAEFLPLFLSWCSSARKLCSLYSLYILHCHRSFSSAANREC